MAQTVSTVELIASIQAFIRYLDDQLGLASLNDTDFRVERTGLVRAQRERAELENKLFKGELHRADDVTTLKGFALQMQKESAI